jgi:hypothetical protein
MPAKRVKLHSGAVVSVKAILLPNGNLLIPRRMEHDRTLAEWAEVAPGNSDYRRWLPVAVSESDPRETAEYRAWRAQVERDRLAAKQPS